MDIRAHNRKAWDREVERGNPWTIPVGRGVIDAARYGRWEIYLTPTKPVPNNWFPDLKGCEVLCLASGGGQQGPILAAAGAKVTVLDNSPKQLEQDRRVAEREALSLVTIEADMADLSALGDASFDLIVHPVSNVFVPDVRPVWREADRVLRRAGLLLAGFSNPAFFIFDQRLAEQGLLQVKHRLPYSDLKGLSQEELESAVEEQIPLEFGHSLEDQIGGQLEAGFVITGFYEDDWAEMTLSRYMPCFIATRAQKP